MKRLQLILCAAVLFLSGISTSVNGVVTSCPAPKKWIAAGDFNFNVSHIFCGDVHKMGSELIAKGGHHVDASQCREEFDKGEQTLSCPNLKLSDPSVKKDGTINSDQVYMKISDQGKVRWVPKHDENGLSTGSTLFPDFLTQEQLMGNLLSMLTPNKAHIARHMKSNGLTGICFPKVGKRLFDVFMVVAPGEKGKIDVITTYPVKACKADSLILHTNSVVDVIPAQKNKVAPPVLPSQDNNRVLAEKTITPKASGNVFSYSNTVQKQTPKSDPLPAEKPPVKAAEKSTFAQEIQSKPMKLAPVVSSVKKEEPTYSAPSKRKGKKKRNKLKNKPQSIESTEGKGREVDEDGDVFFDSSSEMPRAIEPDEDEFYDANL